MVVLPLVPVTPTSFSVFFEVGSDEELGRVVVFEGVGVEWVNLPVGSP